MSGELLRAENLTRVYADGRRRVNDHQCFGFVSLPERGGDKAALAYGDDDRFHESRLVWSYQFNLDLL